MKRRRAITLLGAVAFTSCRPRVELRTFSAIAFGTEVHFQTHGISETLFTNVSEKCFRRLREIESLFSLYDPESTISRLNRDKKLTNPPQEFLELIRTALDYGEKTGGIFDITVQPLWDFRQRWKTADIAERKIMEGTPWKKALALVDYRNVKANSESISLSKPNSAITLNAITQGYATDQIISLLKSNGIRNALVNIGEYAAIGSAPDGKPWSVKLAANGETIPLPPARALAVSAGSGHTFDPEGRFHHIFRPSDGANTRPKSSIVVTAPTATMADALSTTLAIATEAERVVILARFREVDFSEIK